MSAEQPSAPVAPFNPTPTHQSVLVTDETLPDGQKVIRMLVIQPCTTTMLILDVDTARGIADQLFQRANGLQIVRDMPGEGA